MAALESSGDFLDPPFSNIDLSLSLLDQVEMTWENYEGDSMKMGNST